MLLSHLQIVYRLINIIIFIGIIIVRRHLRMVSMWAGKWRVKEWKV